MSNPTVSICMAVFNRSEFLEKTIESLKTQTFCSFEVVIVNDGSTDSKVSNILQSIDDRRFRIITSENRGFTGAIKLAINNSQGEFIAIQGNGDVSLPERIYKQHKILSTNPKQVAVGCFYHNVHALCENELKTPVTFPKLSPEAKDFLSGNNPFSHGEVMFRKTAYNEVGGYREFFKYSQDIDLWLRLSRLGCFYVIPEFLYERGIFGKEGVSANRLKALDQAYYAELAKQCFMQSNTLNEDLISTKGNAAAFYRLPTASMANFLSGQVLELLVKGDKKAAYHFMCLARKEKNTLRRFLVDILTRLVSLPFLGHFLMQILSKHPKRTTWIRS